MINIGVTDWSLDVIGPESLYRAARLGFSSIHVDFGQLGSPNSLEHASVQQAYTQAARQSGVEICAIAVNMLNDYGMTSEIGSEASQFCEAYIREAINAAYALKVHLIFLPSFLYGEIHTSEDLYRTGQVLQTACRYASNKSVRIATENTLDAQRNLALLKHVASDNLSILVDSLNLVLWGHNPDFTIRTMWRYMCNQVHMKDGIGGKMGNAPLGRGEGQFITTVKTLRDLNFSGYVILENEYERDLETKIVDDLKTLSLVFS